MATAHVRGNSARAWQRARIHFFLKLTSMIVFVSKTNFEEIGKELVEIHLSTKNKEKKFKTNAKCRKFSLRFSLEFSKKCHFLLLAAKPVFRKNGLKSWSGGSRPKFLATPCVLTESSSKMILGSGAPRSTILSLFFENWYQKFLPSGKKRVFWEVDFFDKTTKTTVLFFQGALIFFQKQLVNVTHLPFK